jgi:hypothetical protein
VDDSPTEYHSTPESRASRPTSTSSAISTSTPSLASVGSSAASSAYPASPPPFHAPSLSTLHCTLFLLDDKLLIVKRQSASVSGRKITGLDDVAKLVKTGGGISVMEKGGVKKDKLAYRGSVDVLEVIASDVGNGGEHRHDSADQISTCFSNARPWIKANDGLGAPSARTLPSTRRTLAHSTSAFAKTKAASCRTSGLHRPTRAASSYRGIWRHREPWRAWRSRASTQPASSSGEQSAFGQCGRSSHGQSSCARYV